MNNSFILLAVIVLLFIGISTAINYYSQLQSEPVQGARLNAICATPVKNAINDTNKLWTKPGGKLEQSINTNNELCESEKTNILRTCSDEKDSMQSEWDAYKTTCENEKDSIQSEWDAYKTTCENEKDTIKSEWDAYKTTCENEKDSIQSNLDSCNASSDIIKDNCSRFHINLLEDVNNCGNCGNICMKPSICNNGVCSPYIYQAFLEESNNKEVNIIGTGLTDSNNIRPIVYVSTSENLLNDPMTNGINPIDTYNIIDYDKNYMTIENIYADRGGPTYIREPSIENKYIRYYYIRIYTNGLGSNIQRVTNFVVGPTLV